MTFDLSQKILLPDGQEFLMPRLGKMVQPDVLTLIVDALWMGSRNDLKSAVRAGVIADRLARSADPAAVELSDDDIAMIRPALDAAKYRSFLAVPISKAIPKLIEG